MNPIDRLAEIFEHFPGIGPRQAQRFVQYLLRSSTAVRHELIEATKELAGSVHTCSHCMRFHGGAKATCDMCGDLGRDNNHLVIVASDVDLIALERGGTYRGHYFVLGGMISLVSEKKNNLRVKKLIDSLPTRVEKGLKEIILAFPANPEGDITASYVREELRKSAQKDSISITSLGRGLSTGSELEYADPETIKNALDSRR